MEMNKRLEELSTQSINYARENFGTDFVLFHTLWQEKFAELIVRECAGIAYEYDIPNLTGPGEFIGNRMKKHFGVEE